MINKLKTKRNLPDKTATEDEKIFNKLIKTPSERVKSRKLQVKTSSERVLISSERVKSCKLQVKTSSERVLISSERVKSRKLQVKTPSEEVKNKNLTMIIQEKEDMRYFITLNI